MKKILAFAIVIPLGPLYLLIAFLFTHQNSTRPSFLNQENKQVYLPIIAIPPIITYNETFDGDPAQPLPWTPTNWDITVHSRDINTWDTLEPMKAGHGIDCAPSPASHLISQYQDAVFLCKNHVMTAINATGYGAIYLTPDHMVDFTWGEAIIKFDVTTARTSTRDWWDLWISPYDEHLQLPLPDYYPDLSGEPRHAIQIMMSSF